jgi:hypothetical protein
MKRGVGGPSRRPPGGPSPIIVAVMVMWVCGCGGGNDSVDYEPDPTMAPYCGGTCYDGSCCASSDERCPDTLPLEGSPCALDRLQCGYACWAYTEAEGGTFLLAWCLEDVGWAVGRIHCGSLATPHDDEEFDAAIPWDAGEQDAGEEDGGALDGAVDAGGG